MGRAGFRMVLRQSNCKKPSKRVHELHERALFSSELQHSLSLLTNITGHYTAPSHPLGAPRVIGARMWFLEVRTFPAQLSTVNKRHHETLSSLHKIDRTAARVTEVHSRERRRARPGNSRFRVTWPGFRSGPPPLGRDAANQIPRTSRSPELPPEPLATAELHPANRPARPSARRSPGSSLVRPPGRGLSARPPLSG